MTPLESEINRGESFLQPNDMNQIVLQVDEQSKKILWYMWGRRHATLDELKLAAGEHSSSGVLVRIREMINPAARRIWGKPIMVFERSALDYSTGEHILYSWWLNEDAARHKQ